MNNEMIKRYIYAVVSHLPAKMHFEIEKEIESMISDMLEARCGEKEPTETDIRIVLTDLGSPEELAVQYSGEKSKSLISGVYYLWYKKVLSIVLPIAPIGVAFAIFLESFVNWNLAEKVLGFNFHLVGNMLAGAFSAVVQAFTWVTLIFIIMERKKVDFSDDDFLQRLPAVPDKRAEIKLHEPLISIILSIVGVFVFLWFPYLVGIYSRGIGWIPILNESYIRESWLLIIALALIGIISDTVKLIERRYSRLLAVVTVVTKLLSCIGLIVFFTNGKLLNPLFIKNIDSIISGIDIENIGWVFNNINSILMLIILFALFLDIGTTIYRAIRYDK